MMTRWLFDFVLNIHAYFLQQIGDIYRTFLSDFITYYIQLYFTIMTW